LGASAPGAFAQARYIFVFTCDLIRTVGIPSGSSPARERRERHGIDVSGRLRRIPDNGDHPHGEERRGAKVSNHEPRRIAASFETRASPAALILLGLFACRDDGEEPAGAEAIARIELDDFFERPAALVGAAEPDAAIAQRQQRLQV
jgi:hypothetical protein